MKLLEIRLQEMKLALADPATLTQVTDLVTRNVAEWAWPPRLTRVGTAEQWGQALREVSDEAR